jgi:Zn-dependent peptidase ImmA (M78 family)/predicted secreted protein
MNTIRDAILLGVRGATETQTAFRVREQVERRSGPVDIFGLIQELGVSLLFRPLDGLLGACLRMPDVGGGILVTTRRSLHMQRFTAAHELGHYLLEHEGSLDREIRFPGQTANRDLKEVAADAFAAELLMPKWLFKHHAKLHGWTSQKLKDPVNVYQLSLRMAVSYEATCFGLLAHNILDQAAVDTLRAVPPKQTKQRLLRNLTLDDWRAHVWFLDEHDDGGAIEAGPLDVFVADLPERSGSGYLWDTDALESAGFAVVDDVGEQDDGNAVGGPSRRRIILRAEQPGAHRLSMSERRPWEKRAAALRSFDVSVATFGAEVEGLPRRSRPAFQQAALH